jgi:hypothetical protein
MKRPGRKYPRGSYWIQQRDAAFERAGGICEVTGEDLFTVKHGEDCTDNQCATFDDGYCQQSWRRAAHHVIAERWVRRFLRGADPHMLENLVVITPALHARLTGAENLLFNRTNWIGYRQRIHQLGFPLEILDRAFKALCASIP